MLTGEDNRAIQRRRNRLLKRALFALVLMTIAAGIGFIDSWTEAVAPKPDYYEILFEELALQHFLATGTTTIVKEDERTREFFENQYNLRNQKYGFPPGHVETPDSELLQFSYVPGGFGLEGTSLEDISRQQTNPTFNFTEPSGSPLALWVYSSQQGLMACLVYELLDTDVLKYDPPSPDYRIIQTIDRKGVVSVQGSFPDVKAVPTYAYLLPLGDLKLENLDRRSQQEPDLHNLHRLDFALPLLFGSKADGTGIPPYVSGKGTVAGLRAEAALPFFVTRGILQWLVLPIGLLWLSINLWRLGKLYKQYGLALEAHIPITQNHAAIGFFNFLRSDLENKMEEAMAEARTAQYLMIAKQKKEIEKQELEDELREYRNDLDLAANLAKQFDEVLLSGSIEELRKLKAAYRSIIEQKKEQIEKEEQRAKDRQREIQRLENELETIPPEERDKEGREAWSMYQQTKGIEDSRERLRWLKEARRKMPKELRPERF